MDQATKEKLNGINTRLLERADSYDAGGPSSAHTAELLREAANEIDRLRGERANLQAVLEKISLAAADAWHQSKLAR